MAFAGYDDSEDSNARKALGEISLAVGATAADDKFTTNHMLQVPSFRIGDDDTNYVLLSYDASANRFRITRKKSGSDDVHSTVTFA